MIKTLHAIRHLMQSSLFVLVFLLNSVRFCLTDSCQWLVTFDIAMFSCKFDTIQAMFSFLGLVLVPICFCVTDDISYILVYLIELCYIVLAVNPLIAACNILIYLDQWVLVNMKCDLLRVICHFSWQAIYFLLSIMCIFYTYLAFALSCY